MQFISFAFPAFIIFSKSEVVEQILMCAITIHIYVVAGVYLNKIYAIAYEMSTLHKLHVCRRAKMFTANLR